MPATGEFRLSITRALGDQLAAAIQGLAPAPLSAEELLQVRPNSGVYQLYHTGHLVYIGKAERTLQERLRQHARKIAGRERISLDEMEFTALYVDEDLSAVAPETLLINHHRGAGSVPWNTNGFGNKDPGRQRDTSRVEADHFDSLYPASLDYICSSVEPGPSPVGILLDRIKSDLPYTFRYEGGRSRASWPVDFARTVVTVPMVDPTADELFEMVAVSMPGWQITALPGYVIMYEESRRYPSARKVYAYA